MSVIKMRKVITEMCHAHYPVKLDIYLYLKTTNFPGFFGGFFYEKKISMVYWSSAYYLQFVENLILYFSKIMKFGNI